GVQHVLVLDEDPCAGVWSQPSILVQLAPAKTRSVTREKIAEDIRSQLAKEVKEAVIRLRDLSRAAALAAGGGYPVDLAVHGPDADQVRKLAGNIAERLQASKKLTDLGNDPALD